MRLYRLIKKELLQFFRDRAILIFTLYLFTVDIIVAGNGFGISLKRALFLLWDMAKTPESREITSRIREPYFSLVGADSSWEILEKWVERGDTAGAIVIPPDFSRKIAERSSAKVFVVLDGSIISTTMLSYSYLRAIVERYNWELVKKRYKMPDREVPSVDARVRVMFNPNLDNRYYSAVVELFMNVTMISMIISALAFVRERDYGTLEQIKVSPVPFFTFALAKLLFVCMVMLFLVLVGTIFPLLMVFKVPFRGSFPLFMLVSLVAVLSNCGVGLIIAGFSRRMSQVGLLTVLFLAPMLFLSGGWVPPESMPAWLKPLTSFSPLKYYLELGLGVVLKGTTFSEMAPFFLRYVLLSLLLLTAGYAILVRRISSE